METTAVERLVARLAELRRQQLSPPPKLTVSEWADRFRVVSNYSAEPGPWRTDRTPYLREIMDCFSDPLVEKVVFQKCARIGGTEAGLNVVGYFIDQDPSSILIVQPTVDDAKDFSKEQLAPMITDTPALAGKVKDPRSRDSGNTVQSKVHPGGGLFLVGANSPRGFRRRTARILDLEEIDGYPASAGTEGSPTELAIRRTATYGHRRKIYMNSTPTLKGTEGFPGSPIEKEFLEGDQRRYNVPCPHCGEFQNLTWRNLQLDDAEPTYLCAHCGALIGEEFKLRMLERGRWVAENPGATHRSYHINALYSPWVGWSKLRDEWRQAQRDVLKLQVFVNTALGETWEDRGGSLDAGSLESRREAYGPKVPRQVAALTMGIDVQDDRIEYVIRGWGHGEESWLVEHDRVLGDPSIEIGKADSPWTDLEKRRVAVHETEDGRTLSVLTACVDSGHHTAVVYDYTGPRVRHRVWAVKGSSTPGAPLLPRRPTRNNKSRVPLFLIGTDAAKDLIYGRLKIGQPGPGYLHVPDWTIEDWFTQVTAERVTRKQVSGRWRRVYELPRGARNEVLDCEVYALAAIRLAPVRLSRWVPPAAEAPASGADQVADAPPEPFGARPPPARRVVPERRGWVGGWRR